MKDKIFEEIVFHYTVAIKETENGAVLRIFDDRQAMTAELLFSSVADGMQWLMRTRLYGIPTKWESKTNDTVRFKSVASVYTGGNIWLFYGQLEDGTWFITTDDGYTAICDASPEDLEESLMPEWDEEHVIRWLEKDERHTFCEALVERLLAPAYEDLDGGITEQEINYYRNTWRGDY